jgi:riboflavin kinase/FMN adenylyltransferase
MAVFYIEETGRLPLHKPVITIGTFDGVHLGHRAILDEVKRYAASIGGESMVITFEPHPRQILQPEVPIEILTPLPQKLELIQEAGIKHVAVAQFNKEFSCLTAEAYIEEFLVNKFNPNAIVIGYDHQFGHDRRGDIGLLQSYASKHDYSVHQIPAHMVHDAAISSTKIRNALAGGIVDEANSMLGRTYALRGTVIEGQQLGRTLGYPTANVHPLTSVQLVPANGVYAVRVRIATGKVYGGMLNIGVRPTVGGSLTRHIEVHLFDYSEDIYNSTVELQFVRKVRDEEKFPSLDALKEQLGRDEVLVREVLG